MKDQKIVRDAALGWFVKMRSGDATRAEHADFQHWLGAAESHRREYQALQALWGDLDQMGDPRLAPMVEAPSARRAGLSRRSLLIGVAGGGVAAAAAMVLGLPALFRGDISTGVGELRALELADGSRVELDADSSLSMDFTPQARRVTLWRGRAFFDVAPDPARPFSVAASEGVTTAVGTQFSVHLWSDEVTVAVTESAVDIRAGDGQAARIKAGEAVSYDASGIGAVEAVSGSQADSWRRGRLIFEDRPLRQVIADVNRYRRGTILVTDSTLLRLRVSGIFDVHKPDGVLDAITRSLPVGALQLSPYLVLLYPA